ncbi:MAG: hypothetical protein CYPHOPRED_004845, partial [Cyphobasidiales sp. Tagirdzhanova-0007]
MRTYLRSFSFTALLGVSAVPHDKRQSTSSANLTADIAAISNYWGDISPYTDNALSYFGVEQTGLPNGCGEKKLVLFAVYLFPYHEYRDVGIEQVHLITRHGARYATPGFDDGLNDGNLSTKITNS